MPCGASRPTNAAEAVLRTGWAPRKIVITFLERVYDLCARAVVFEKLWLQGEKRRDTSWYREYF